MFNLPFIVSTLSINDNGFFHEIKTIFNLLEKYLTLIWKNNRRVSFTANSSMVLFLSVWSPYVNTVFSDDTMSFWFLLINFNVVILALNYQNDALIFKNVFILVFNSYILKFIQFVYIFFQCDCESILWVSGKYWRFYLYSLHLLFVNRLYRYTDGHREKLHLPQVNTWRHHHQTGRERRRVSSTSPTLYPHYLKVLIFGRELSPFV